MNVVADSTDLYNTFADKEFVEKIIAKCTPEQIDVINSVLDGLMVSKISKQLKISRGTYYNRMNNIQKIATKLLQPPDPVGCRQCRSCLEWLEEKEGFYQHNGKWRERKYNFCKKCCRQKQRVFRDNKLKKRSN